MLLLSFCHNSDQCQERMVFEILTRIVGNRVVNTKAPAGCKQAYTEEYEKQRYCMGVVAQENGAKA
jgi:hypothetical protein